MATLDLERTLARIKREQWALADLDWDAPGADRITTEQRPKLRAFMIDLMWIEHVGARAFAAIARQAPGETLRQIYRYFHAEEQRHANVEMALLRRWGMLDGDAIPEPNVNIRLVIEWLDRYGDDMPLDVLGAVIPMLEVALDGALCKFLLETVEDPLCQQAFTRINEDESRHLAVGFHVLEMLGHGGLSRLLIHFAGTVLNPKLILGVLAYGPLLNRMRDNVVALGLPEERLYDAMAKYRRVGRRSRGGRRNPWFRLISWHGATVADRRHPYHVPVDALVRLTDHIPARILPPTPRWVDDLTWRPTA